MMVNALQHVLVFLLDSPLYLEVLNKFFRFLRKNVSNEKQNWEDEEENDEKQFHKKKT